MFKVGDIVRLVSGTSLFRFAYSSEVFEIKTIMPDGPDFGAALAELIYRLPGYGDNFAYVGIGMCIHLYVDNLVKVDLNRHKKLRHYLEIRNLAL